MSTPDQVRLVRLVAAAEREKARVHPLRRLADAVILDDDRVLYRASFSHETYSDPAGEITGIVEGLLPSDGMWPAGQSVEGRKVEITQDRLPRTLRCHRPGLSVQLALALQFKDRLHGVDGAFSKWILGSAGEYYPPSVSTIPSHRIPMEKALAPALLRVGLLKWVGVLRNDRQRSKQLADRLATGRRCRRPYKGGVCHLSGSDHHLSKRPTSSVARTAGS